VKKAFTFDNTHIPVDSVVAIWIHHSPEAKHLQKGETWNIVVVVSGGGEYVFKYDSKDNAGTVLDSFFEHAEWKFPN
jgi:hypothetical protein